MPKIWRPSCNQGPRCALVTSRRRDAAGSTPVRHIGVSVIKLPPERDVLARHVIVGCRQVPGCEGIARILGEVWRAAGGGGAIDGWQQHQIASGVVDLAAAQRETVAIFVEPPTVVQHEAQEALLVPN